MILGPVSNAAHSEPTVAGGLFSITVGLIVLAYAWIHFLRIPDDEAKPPLYNLIGLSLICSTMIGFGVWEWIRALRISN